jgi:hypothetical protein
VPGTARLTVVIDERFYTAPRVGEVEACGRAVRRARCGHRVYVSEQGLDAVGRRGKRLICDRCYAALAGEHGASTGVYWIDDDAGGEPEAAA